VKHQGSYVFPPKLKSPVRGVSYPVELLRAAFELREEEFKEFRGVRRLAEIVEGAPNFPELDKRAVQTALRQIVDRDEYSRVNPTLKNRLTFEARHFVPYGFYEHPPLVGIVKGFLFRPLQERPYTTAHFFKARQQLRYWRRCLKMVEALGDLSGAPEPEVFWERPHWKRLRRDPLWERAIANLVCCLCYERTKSEFFKGVREELTAPPGGEERIFLCFSYPVTDLQRMVNRIPGYALNSAQMVWLSKKLWRCLRGIHRQRGRELTFWGRLLIRLFSLRMSGLRWAYKRTAQKTGS
jgi:hypothetical protein